MAWLENCFALLTNLLNAFLGYLGPQDGAVYTRGIIDWVINTLFPWILSIF